MADNNFLENNKPCSYFAGFGVWSEWSACTESCGDAGVQLRVRQCTKTLPELCTGHNSQKRKCNTMSCKGRHKNSSNTPVSCKNLIIRKLKFFNVMHTVTVEMYR